MNIISAYIILTLFAIQIDFCRSEYPQNITILNTPFGFQFNETLNNSLGSNESIVIYHVSSEIAHGKLTWKKNLANAIWQSFPENISLKEPTFVYNDSWIRFSPEASFQGLVTISYSVMQGSKMNENVSGEVTHQIFLLVPPEEPYVKFSDDVENIFLEVMQKSSCAYKELNLTNKIILPSNISNVPVSMQMFLDKEVYDLYREAIENFTSMFIPMLAITSYGENEGGWYYEKGNASIQISSVPLYLTLDTKFCFVSRNGFFGPMEATFSPVLKQKNSTKYVMGSKSHTLLYLIWQDYFQPQVNAPIIHLSPIPYMEKDFISNEYRISDLIARKTGCSLNVVTDRNADLTGIFVTYGVESSYGYFEYNCGDMWKKIDTSKISASGFTTQLDRGVYLKTDSMIRFRMKSNQQWSFLTALQQVHLKYVAIDQIHNRCGSNRISLKENGIKSFSEMMGRIVQSQYDCNNKTVGSDTCDDSNSTDFSYNNCGYRIGGDTGRSLSYGQDCAGVCNGTATSNNTCNFCRSSEENNLTDCHGTCFGNATINKCGVCVGGLTSKLLNDSVDECGVCNGNNTSCLDCKNIPNGTHSLDLCGVCNSENDIFRNYNCQKLGKISPVILDESRKVNIELADNGTFVNVSCKFIDRFGNSIESPNSTIIYHRQNERSVQVDSPSLFPTTHNINCTFNNHLELEASNILHVISETTMRVQVIQPEVSMVNTKATIFMLGSQFTNSQDLVCIYGKNKLILKANFHSDANISCEVPAQMKSQINDICLSFIKSSRTNPTQKLCSKHKISINVPKVVKIYFDKVFAHVIVEFNKPLEMKNQSESCSNIFDVAGERNCKFASTSILFIYPPLLPRSTIYVGLNVTVNLSKIKARESEFTVYPQTVQNILVTPPDEFVEQVFNFASSQSLGKCGIVHIFPMIMNYPTRHLYVFTWDISVYPPNITAQNFLQNRLNNIKNHHRPGSLSSNILHICLDIPDQSLMYSVSATNELYPKIQINASTVVHCKSSVSPSVRLFAHNIETYASENTYIDAELTIGSHPATCQYDSKFKPKFFSEWIIKPFVNIKKTNSWKLIIPKNTLKAHTNYTATLFVQMDGTAPIIEDINIQVKSAPLIAIISGSSVIPYDDVLVFSGMKSYDPDHMNVSPYFYWSVSEMDGSFVVHNGNRLLLPHNQTINISVSKYFRPMRFYIFKMQYQIGKRSSQAIHKVYVGQKMSPQITIYTTNNSLVNPSDKVVIKAVIKSSSRVLYQWESVTPENFNKYFNAIRLDNDTAMSETSGIVQGVKTVSLILKPYVLSQFSSIKYRFLLTVINGSSMTHANIDVYTNGLPVPGDILAVPATGILGSTVNGLEGDMEYRAYQYWSDPEASYLGYSYSYILEGMEIKSEIKMDTKFVTTLPGGNLTYRIYAYDKFGAFVYKEKHNNFFQPKVNNLNSGLLKKIENKLQDYFTSGDFSNLMTVSSSVMVSIKAHGEKSIELLNKKYFQDYALNLIGNVVDRGGIQRTLNKITATAFFYLTDDAKMLLRETTLLNTVKSVSYLYGNQINCQQQYEIIPRSSSEIQKSLQTFENLIDPSKFDPSTMMSKSYFQKTLAPLSQSLCMDTAMGENGKKINNKLVTLHVMNRDFNNVDTVNITFPCSSCPDDDKSYSDVDYLYIGSHIKDVYNDYNCQHGEICTGLCTATTQFTDDIFTWRTNIYMRSRIMMVHFFNPATYQTELSGEIPGGIVFRLAVTVNSSETLTCHRWNGTQWSIHHVSTSPKYVHDSMYTYVDCNLTMNGYVVLLNETEPLPYIPSVPTSSSTAIPVNPSTSNVMTSSAVFTPTTTTTTPLSTTLFSVSFRIPHPNCEKLFNATTKATFTLEIKIKVATILSVAIISIKNFEAECGSIVLNYQQGPSDNLTAEEIVKKTEGLVTSSNLNITIDGEVYTADKTSFSSIQVTQTPMVTKDDDDDDLSGGAVAGIVIGVIVFVVIILLVACLCLKKKNRKDEIGVEMGEKNYGYHH